MLKHSKQQTCHKRHFLCPTTRNSQKSVCRRAGDVAPSLALHQKDVGLVPVGPALWEVEAKASGD